jgi:hypothetical protein
MGRRACRRRVKGVLSDLAPLDRPADAMTRLWLAARCERCAMCPKMLTRLGVIAPDRPLPAPILPE